jgi:hypothetical protein
LNHAEPNIRRLAAFAFANAVRANLNFMLTHTDMYRGAQAQSRLNLVDTPTGCLHLGLWVGSLKRRVELQDSHDC